MNGGQSTIHCAEGLVSGRHSGEDLGVDSGRLSGVYGFSSSVYIKPPRDFTASMYLLYHNCGHRRIVNLPLSCHLLQSLYEPRRIHV